MTAELSQGIKEGGGGSIYGDRRRKPHKTQVYVQFEAWEEVLKVCVWRHRHSDGLFLCVLYWPEGGVQAFGQSPARCYCKSMY